MSYDYRIPQGRDKGKRTNGMFSLGGKLGSVLSALGNGEKLMQVRLWQNWEMVMGPDIAPAGMASRRTERHPHRRRRGQSRASGTVVHDPGNP